MFSQAMRDEIEQWRLQATSPDHQLDRRWVTRYRELASYDSYWWLTWAGPFTEEEQQQWDRWFRSPIDEAKRERLAPLLKQSRERELEMAIAEQREPCLLYPAIEIDEVRRRIADLAQLDAEIEREESHLIIRSLYHGAIEEELDFLRVIEATYERNNDKYWRHMMRLCPLPTSEDMLPAFARIRNMLIRGFKWPETRAVSQRFHEFIETRLHLTLDLSADESESDEEQQPITLFSPSSRQEISSQATKRFFEAVFHECGFEGWSVIIDANNNDARIEQGLRRLFLPDRRFTVEKIRNLLIHELLGHVARCIAGEYSPLGLLGIHTKNSLPTEEGIALFHERQLAALRGEPFSDKGIRNLTLKIGLAMGVMTPPQTFLSVYTFFELFSLLSRLLANPGVDQERLQRQTREYAFSMCLRTFRGVPDLHQAGICYLQDTVYLYGLHLIEQAVAEDETILDRLAVGVVALEDLHDLQELGITSVPQPLRKLAYDPDLDSYILSFEQQEVKEQTV